jgi:hypothetical protein
MGSVRYLRVCNLEAPSIIEASKGSLGKATRAAVTTRIVKGSKDNG